MICQVALYRFKSDCLFLAIPAMVPVKVHALFIMSGCPALLNWSLEVNLEDKRLRVEGNSLLDMSIEVRVKLELSEVWKLKFWKSRVMTKLSRQCYYS